MKQIEVIIDSNGEVTIDVNGVSGPACENYIKALTDALEAEIISDDKKPEYFVTDSQMQNV